MSKLATSLKIVPARQEHLAQVLDSLGEYARFDGAGDPEDLRRMTKRSVKTFAVMFEGKPVAVWGIEQHNLMENDGYVWFVGSRAVEEHPFLFIRYSQMMLREEAKRFAFLHCTVRRRDDKQLRWLKLIGFSERPMGLVYRDAYARFVMEGNNVRD